jgi:four helix bundle protein
VWEKSHPLVLAVYSAASKFPRDESFGLTSQVRRAATSIPSNIAEGCGRSGDGELRRFLFIAMGSANELEYQLLLARDLEYLQGSDYEALSGALNEVKRMLSGLIDRLRETAN